MVRFRDTHQPDQGSREERWPDPMDVVRALGLDAGRSLADVGCGDGYFTLPAAEVVAPATVYAIDVDGTLLDEIDALAIEEGLENVRTISGGWRDLATLLPEQVHDVLITDPLEGVDASTALAEQVFRALRPGGRFLIVNRYDVPPEESTERHEHPGPSSNRRMMPSETRSAIAAAGFEPIEDVDLPPSHYGLVLKRTHDR